MLIGIDYRLALNSNRGMGRYTREIVRKLMKIDKENQYILYTDKIKDNLEKLPDNFSFKELGNSNYILFEQISLAKQARKDKLNILWCPANTFPLMLNTNIKLFVTIHDLIFMNKNIKDSGSLYQNIGKIYRKYCIKIGRKKINKVFTVSEYSKRQIEDKLKLKDIIVTYNNVDNFIEKLSTHKETNILSKLGVEKNKYIYTVSGTAPSKNLKTIIKVFESEDIDKKIVVTGISNYKSTIFYKEIMQKGLDKKIIFSGQVSDDEMIDLYKNSERFLFISLAEGFGIPLVEAMFFDIPIICSNVSCMPEIVGELASLVDPLDVEKIRELVINMVNNNKTKETQINKFNSWENTATIVINAFLEKKGLINEKK